MKNEVKSIPLEVKDLDKGKRTARIAFAAYNNVDRTKDILRPGAFTKSWKESGDEVALYFNHDDTKSPGLIKSLTEDQSYAYADLWLGTHTLGEDTLKMLDEGIIKKSSFGYQTIKSNNIDIKGEKVRELKELALYEVSVLTKMPANPKTHVTMVQKSFEMPKFSTEFKTLSSDEQTFLANVITTGNASLFAAIMLSNSLDVDSDLYTYINYFISRTADQMADLKSQLKWGSKAYDGMKADLKALETFCRNSTASDDCIQLLQKEADEIKSILSDDTASTSDGKPVASIDKDYADQVLTQLFINQAKA